jgi:hypothetical protein
MFFHAQDLFANDVWFSNQEMTFSRVQVNLMYKKVLPWKHNDIVLAEMVVPSSWAGASKVRVEAYYSTKDIAEDLKIGKMSGVGIAAARGDKWPQPGARTTDNSDLIAVGDDNLGVTGVEIFVISSDSTRFLTLADGSWLNVAVQFSSDDESISDDSLFLHGFNVTPVFP